MLLVTGKEEFLSERVVTQVRRTVRAHDAEAELAESEGARLSLAVLGELAAPSLFSPLRCVVVRSLQDLPEESVAGVLAYAAEPAEDVALVLVHNGGPKGSGVLTRLRTLDAVTETKSGEVKPSDLPRFVAGEVREHGGGIDQAGARALVEAVGHDLRSLAAAGAQLVPDFPGVTITPGMVGRYFGGRAEAKSFAVADAAVAGRRQSALEELRWALDNGTAPVLVTSAFAGSVRGLARYRGAPRGMREADLAREVGVPPWKLRTVRAESRAGPTRRWSPRCRRWPAPTRTSRARPATPPTPWSGSCSPSRACASAERSRPGPDRGGYARTRTETTTTRQAGPDGSCG